MIVVHDFPLKDERSPTGQGYAYAYSGLTVRTFAGAGFTPRQNVFDTNGKMRLWAGAAEGVHCPTAEDGNADNGSNYSGDYIGLISMGPNRPGLVAVEYQGDPNWTFTYTKDYSLTVDAWTPAQRELMPGETSRAEFKMDGEARWVYARFQLTSHPADGNFAISDPPFVPLPIYGCINEITFKTGRRASSREIGHLLRTSQ